MVGVGGPYECECSTLKSQECPNDSPGPRVPIGPVIVVRPPDQTVPQILHVIVLARSTGSSKLCLRPSVDCGAFPLQSLEILRHLTL